MYITNIHEAKTHLSKLIEKVYNQEEEVVICKAGKPMVKITKYTTALKPRVPGLCKGEIKISKDFDDLPQSFMKNFR
ncbi:MAG: type II toxin-antitoxin system prevent-host-death family antitoxin [Alphaproteobacteria bacterium]|nr:type II toxin-antitoxin system prevent-host-death family antitoxin [Alphaproteobacteria bacterium]OJV16044.1 MAG: hypothetical protein BGO27_04275 [Alphaproteobacteria bacterium 33-17]